MLNTPLLVLALAFILLPALYAFSSELISPAARYLDAGFNQRLSALSVQQGLSVIGLIILGAGFFLTTLETLSPIIFWGLIIAIGVLQMPLFWLRNVDLRQAVKGINWPGAKKRNAQLQTLLLIQIILTLMAFAVGVEWTGSPQAA